MPVSLQSYPHQLMTGKLSTTLTTVFSSGSTSFVWSDFLQMHWKTEVNGAGLLGWAYFNFICELKAMIHLAIPYCAKTRFVQGPFREG